MPRKIEENVARLRRWQEIFTGDGFIFDYHFFTDHYKDPGYSQISKMLFDDIKNLDKLGLNGTVNCQLTRAFFPTGLGLYLMARALWNKNSDFATEANAYYQFAFGDSEVKKYFENLSELFDPPYIRREKTQADPAAAEKFKSIPAFIDAFGNSFINKGTHRCVNRSREILRLHGMVCKLLSKALYYRAKGMKDESLIVFKDVESWARLNDKNLNDVLDLYVFIHTWRGVFENDEPSFA